MSSRKLGYLFGILLLALICSWPQLFLVSSIIASGRYNQLMPSQHLHNWGRVHRDEHFISGFWQDRLTDHRQRLGDLVADTLVVESSTLRT